MANNRYSDGSGDWTAVANWPDTGAAPVAADTVLLMRCIASRVLATNLPGAAAGVNYAGLQVGPEFRGKLGAVATPLYVGTVVADIRFGSLYCQEAFLAVDAGDSSSINIDGTGSGPNALHLLGPGTWANVRVRRGAFVRIGATAVVTNLIVMGDNCHVMIESGATVTNIIQCGGVIDCEAAVTNVTMTGGIFNHQGSTTYNITALNLYGNARFNYAASDGTITTANLYGNSLLNCDDGVGYARTITTVNRFGGTLDVRGAGNMVTLSTENSYSGTKLVGAA